MARGHLPTHHASPPAKADWFRRRPHSVCPEERKMFWKKTKTVTTKEDKALCKELDAFYRSFQLKKKLCMCLREKSTSLIETSFWKLHILRCYNCTHSMPIPFLGTLGKILAEQTGYVVLGSVLHLGLSPESNCICGHCAPLASSWAHGAPSWATQEVAKQWPLLSHTWSTSCKFHWKEPF